MFTKYSIFRKWQLLWFISQYYFIFQYLFVTFWSYFLQQFDKYFAANAIEKGGSFYLQSKIYRAKELLDEYEEEKAAEEQQKEEQAKQW